MRNANCLLWGWAEENMVVTIETEGQEVMKNLKVLAKLKMPYT